MRISTVLSATLLCGAIAIATPAFAATHEGGSSPAPATTQGTTNPQTPDSSATPGATNGASENPSATGGATTDPNAANSGTGSTAGKHHKSGKRGHTPSSDTTSPTPNP